MKKSLIVIPFILAMYQTYLVNRIWQFELPVNIMVGIFFTVAMYVIFYLFIKNIEPKKIKKKVRMFLLMVSIVVSVLVMIFNFDFLVKKYKPTSVTIEQDKSQPIMISYIVKDNVIQPLDQKEKCNHCELTFEKCKSAIIVLEKGETTGNILIKEGKKEKQVEWQDDLGIYVYEVTENRVMTLLSTIRMFLSFAMIEILSYILCLSSYYLYKEKKSLLLPTLIVIAIVRIAFYQEIQFNVTFLDSVDYRKHSFEELFSGKLQDRTPLYPLFIQFFILVCGGDIWKNFTCIAQIIISFLATIYFYKTLRIVVKWEKLIAIITFLYGVSVAVMGWDTIILTESLALSTTVWFCYLMFKYLKTNQLKYGISSTILIFLMTFLRPSFIGFVAIVFAFFLVKIALEKENRKKDRICLLVSSITIILILGYATAFYQQYDIFSITKASVRQDLDVCMHQGFYKNSKDEQFIKDVEESNKRAEQQGILPWNATMEILEQYGNKRVQELVKISKKESRKEYIKYVANLITTEAEECFSSYHSLCISKVPNMKYNLIRTFTFLKFLTVYLIMIIEAIISIYKWIKYKKPDWIHLGLFGFIMAMLFTSFIGTNAEFMRTAICVVPFSYLALGIIISEGIEKYKEKSKNKLRNRRVEENHEEKISKNTNLNYINNTINF